jgi:hypothetical protein
MFDIIKIEDTQAREVFTYDKMIELCTLVESEARKHVPDVSTDKGRKAIASNAYKVSQSKTYVEKFGKALSAELKIEAKKVDKARKLFRDRMDSLRDEVRRPLAEWEKAEADRIAAEKLKAEIEIAHQEALEYNAFLDKQKEIEEREKQLRIKQEEIARKEREEQIRRDAEERAALKAQAEIERKEREAALKIKQAEEERRAAMLAEEKAKKDAEEAAKKAEQDRLEAIEAEKQKAKQAAERKERERIKKEREALEEKERIAADKNHRRLIIKEAELSFRKYCGDITPEKAVSAICDGKIKHIHIEF